MRGPENESSSATTSSTCKMVGSRIHKIGSIFDRVTSLLKQGVLKKNEKPLWYDVYQNHPPKYEPVFDRETPDIKVKPILYEEDIIRAKVHEKFRSNAYNMEDVTQKTRTRSLIKSCQYLMKNEGLTLESALEKISSRERKNVKFNAQSPAELQN